MAPNSELTIKFRPGVRQHFDFDGWRITPGHAHVSPDAPKIGVYGCSFTQGTALGDDETYTARLQEHFPDIAFLNRGVAGYSTVQSLLALRQDIQAQRVDAAIFTTISHHRWRNRATPDWLGRIRPAKAFWTGRAVEAYPTAIWERDGVLRIEYVPLYQPGLGRGDPSAFLPEEHSLDRLLFALLDEVRTMARDAGLPLAFALLDQVDQPFNALYAAHVKDGVDISVPYDTEHFFIPLDNHPNMVANRLYADGLGPIVEKLTANIGKGMS